jgi:hypothetical protein
MMTSGRPTAVFGASGVRFSVVLIAADAHPA